MNNVSANVESQFKVLSAQFIALCNQAAQIVKQYNATDAVTLVTALSTNSTPATVSTALTKYQFESGITFCTQIANFFAGSSVSQADYLGICETLISGDAPAGSPLSPGVESLGQQLLTLAQNVITYYEGAVIANAAYNQNGLAQCISAINGAVVMPGSNSTGSEFSAAITMVLQFINMLTNQSVFASNYFNTAIQWTQD